MATKIESFDKVIGHRNLMTYLKHWLETETVPDVILFHGPAGLGKSSIAKLLAIELTTTEEDRESVTDSVIRNNRSTGSIKLFNMSTIEDREEEIQKVSAELNMNFVDTKHKVLILDEAHEMSRQAQNSILTELEHLPKGLHVFICTTDAGALRPAFMSRCREIPLHPLSDNEAQQLFNRVVKERGQYFELSNGMAAAVVCSWAENMPRKIVNLLENFEKNSLIKTKDLELFVNTINSAAPIELLKYLYGSLTLGIDFIGSIKLDETFIMIMIEITKVALGINSTKLSVKDCQYIRSFMEDKDVNKLLQFVIEISGLSTLARRRVISAFMRAHVSFMPRVAPEKYENTQSLDLQTLSENVEIKAAPSIKTVDTAPVESLDMLFARSNGVQ
ncbi:MAG: AAA family ATPase [Alphaproteobacteria bacterium]|nr:AAA family ATPase [Alphaproteobacteria bacterium]